MPLTATADVVDIAELVFWRLAAAEPGLLVGLSAAKEVVDWVSGVEGV